MTEIKRVEMVPEDEYEVLIQTIEWKVSKGGRGYFLCTTVIEDECPQKGRKLFTGYARRVEGLPTHPSELRIWTPRYALVRVRHKVIAGDQIYMNVTIRTLI